MRLTSSSTSVVETGLVALLSSEILKKKYFSTLFQHFKGLYMYTETTLNRTYTYIKTIESTR